MKIFSVVLLALTLFVSSLFGYIEDSTGVPMRDGMRLGTDIYRPFWSIWPLNGPVLLQRTPYDRGWDSLYLNLICDVMGYVFVVQSVRGYGDSEGEPMVFLTDGWGELQDGYDAIEWIADQWWCNGDVGMLGASAHGMTQYYAAGALPPHLACCGPMVAAPSLYRDCAFTGGEFRKAMVETWLTGVGTPWLIDSVCYHPNYEPMWEVVDLSRRYDVANYAMLHIEGWYDMYTDGVLEAFSELQKRYHNQKLYIGPWGHGDAFGSTNQGDLTYPSNAEMSYLEFIQMLLGWYDYWMNQGGGPVPAPKVKFYLMGDCDTQDTTQWNHWVEADTWPLPNVVYKNYYLKDNSILDSFPPLGNEVDTFLYDPADPCTTYGGREFIGLTHGYGPINQNPIESRSDVLVFSTSPLPDPLTVLGKLKFVLYAASDRYDTDWTVRVSDVYPDGRSILVTDNILMARHRHGFDREDPLVPDVPDTFNIDLWSTAQVFNAGHRIRVIISSSNYPRYEKNPNTGAPFTRNDPVFVTATQKVYRTSTMPSHLLLPIIPPANPAVEETAAQHGLLPDQTIFVPTISREPRILLQLASNRQIEIHIYDILGREVWSINRSVYQRGKYELKPALQANGIYFVRSAIDGQVMVNKFILCR